MMMKLIQMWEASLWVNLSWCETRILNARQCSVTHEDLHPCLAHTMEGVLMEPGLCPGSSTTYTHQRPEKAGSPHGNRGRPFKPNGHVASTMSEITNCEG